METRLQRRDNLDGVERIEVLGEITQNGWMVVDRDPLVKLFGDDIYGQRVMLNLSKSAYVDSMGVEWLLHTHRRFREHGGRLILHSPSPACRQLFGLMRMEKVLEIAPDESTARNLFAEEPHEYRAD